MVKRRIVMEENTMSNEFYTLTDEDGNELEFEMIGQCEMNGVNYYAMIPADASDDGEFYEYTILKSVEEDGEEVLVSIDDDEEFDNVADYFDDLFSEEIDYDASESDNTK